MISNIFKRLTGKPALQRHRTLSQWQEESYIFVTRAFCIAVLPPLMISSLAAVTGGLWINLISYNAAYIVCVAITLFRAIPFRVRACAAVLVFLAMGLLSIFTIGVTGSGRIWLFLSTVFATLVLGIRAGTLVIALQAAGLFLIYHFLRTDFTHWAKLENFSPRVWAVTSITLLFLSVISMIAVGRLIRGISSSLEESKKMESDLQRTARQLSDLVKQHDQTILSLKESEERWHFALEGAGDGVWDWDVPSDTIYFSAQWKRIVGFESDSARETPRVWFDRIHPEERDAVVDALRRHIREGIPSFQNRYRLRCGDGTYRWILDRGKVMARAADGTPTRIIGTHADITMVKELENQKLAYEARLQQAQKMEAIGTLAGGIAHDFNNILFPILGYSEMLLSGIGQADDSAKKGLTQIYSSALRARELVHQILTFARRENTAYRPLSVENILKEVVKLLRSTIPKNIEINQHIPSKCRPISADAIQVHQIIMNLVTNASHAIGDAGGEINIHLEEREITPVDARNLGIMPGTAVCLSVADTGSGMTPDLIPRIFDPFFTTKQKGEGTGMGLSVVHGIVEKMGGSIKVFSEPGQGTAFKLYFPAGEAAEPSAAPDPADSESICRGTERILIVDDEHAILAMQKRMLRQLGYRVTAESRPEAALETFRDAPEAYDLVITDLSMPGMSGNDLTRELLRIRPDIPVLMCTGFRGKMTPETARKNGIREVLIKPVLIRDLSATIRRILGDPV